jgi:tight adherence protein C
MSLLFMFSLMAAFVAIALGSGALAFLVLEHQSPGRRRLAQVGALRGPEPAPPEVATLTDAPNHVIVRVASFVPKSPKELTSLRRRLARAGYQSLTAAVVYAASEIVLPLLVASLFIVFLGWRGGFIFALGGAVVGFLIPSLVLSRMIETRRKAISHGLPDALDLLIVCLEAGSSLDQAIVRATKDMAIAHPALTEEFTMLASETRAGKPRLEAFRNLQERTKNDDVRALVAMLVQTDRFGTSVAQSLRTFAEVSRTKRRQRAEEKAAKVGVKLVFPLVLCLFPALFVATAGAAVVQIINVFGQAAAR